MCTKLFLIGLPSVIALSAALLLSGPASAAEPQPGFTPAPRQLNRTATVTVENDLPCTLTFFSGYIQGSWTIPPLYSIPPGESSTFATTAGSAIGSTEILRSYSVSCPGPNNTWLYPDAAFTIDAFVGNPQSRLTATFDGFYAKPLVTKLFTGNQASTLIKLIPWSVG
jgi:hypothetical protein